ncbi:MAG: hypothetical protein PHN44_02735 [Candidatus Marinimicrobia bacterium]|nr:hypothetical protein [Candidatus Neomarinimicrobiota bacterium]MDD5539745.1 hypothetical protein [Candidatus Neomarinimicrobiota bacterium]
MKSNKKILYLLITLMLAALGLWYFISKNEQNSTSVQAKTSLELKPADLAKIEEILDNIISLDLTALQNTAPDQNVSPPYPRRNHRDPFQFGASPSIPLTLRPTPTASDVPKKTVLTSATKPPPAFNPQNLEISGVIYDRRKPAAIIEGEVYFTGDSIRNMKILRITPNTLILTCQGKQYNLKVLDDE